MNGAASPQPTFAAAVAEDAEALAALHDRELTPELLAALREVRFPDSLGLLPATAAATAAWRALRDALALLPASPDAGTFDELAAEYAAVYLTNAYGASPLESFWTDDDHLVCQEAMFQLRAIYAAAGLATPDWRQRPDDHLVLQLLYVAHAARAATAPDDWRALARMLDEHLLRWVEDFAAHIVLHDRYPHFYAGLAVLTAAWLDNLRELLDRQLGEPRPTRAEIEARLKRAAAPEAQPVAFVPGGRGPSW